MTSPDSPHNEMNAIIHHGLRRDLDRMSTVLHDDMPTDQRLALCDHIVWMLDYLHQHHVGEDEGVWPLTLSKRPDLQPLMDEMETEHEALSASSDGLRTSANRYRTDGSDEARQALAAAVQQMKDTTLPHLDHEEQVAMPLILEALDDDDWDYLEKNYFRKDVGFSQVGPMFAWLLDDLDPRRAAVVRTQLPRPLMWFMDRRYGGRYDSAAAQRWGDLAGTRA